MFAFLRKNLKILVKGFLDSKILPTFLAIHIGLESFIILTFELLQGHLTELNKICGFLNNGFSLFKTFKGDPA